VPLFFFASTLLADDSTIYGPPTKGDASSWTTSAVAEGTIDIRENSSQDISALSRDTENALNELGRIFDKKKIKEKGIATTITVVK
jgi:putative uncharacterized protein (fragment)